MKIINQLNRTDAIRALTPGDSIIWFPCGDNSHQQEASSLKATATKFGITLELKKYLLVAEGEISIAGFRVTHMGPRKPSDLTKDVQPQDAKNSD